MSLIGDKPFQLALWSTSTTNAALKMSCHSLDVLTWPHSQLASDFMGGGSLHQPPPTDTALLSTCSRGWLGWKSGHFDLVNTPDFGKEFNETTLQNKSTIKKAVITAFLCPFPSRRHLRESHCDEQLSRLLFNRRAWVTADFLFTLEPRAKIACSSCNLLICCHEVSLVLQLPAHSICDKCRVRHEIQGQLRIQLFFMRGSAEVIVYPEPVWAGGRRNNSCVSRQMEFSSCSPRGY